MQSAMRGPARTGVPQPGRLPDAHGTDRMITNLVVALALAAPAPAAVDAALRGKALGIVASVLASGERWTKVHAAEALIAAGDRDAARRAFEGELAAHGSEPQYRIGIWRVLAQSARTEVERDRFVR